jgi:hypothetical protein
MKWFFSSWKKMSAEFGVKAILDAFLGALIFAIIVMGPVYIILVEVLIVYFYRVYTLAVLLIVATLFLDLLIHRLAKQALLKKKPDAEAPVGKVLFWQSVGWACLLFSFGMVVLFVLIPVWMV